eukprot:6079789-Pleurochrysis_carterae.AAC.1
MAKARTNKGASAHRAESVKVHLDHHSRRGRAPTASSNFITCLRPEAQTGQHQKECQRGTSRQKQREAKT